MKNIVKLTAMAAVLGIALTGCSGSKEVSSDTSQETSGVQSESANSAPEVVHTAEIAADTKATAEDASGGSTAEQEQKPAVVLLDLDGTPIDVTTAKYTSYEYDSIFIFNGFAWFAEPTGKALATVNGTEPQPMEYTGNEFRRFEVGAVIDGLELTSAETWIEVYNGESWFNGCNAEFTGSSEITGYLFVQQEPDYLVQPGDILFLPEDGGCSLPVIYNPRQSFTSPFFYEGIGWENEYDRQFRLGNVSDYQDKDWLALIPADGTPVRVTAAVDNVRMSYYGDSHMSGNGDLWCVIQSLSLAE